MVDKAAIHCAQCAQAIPRANPCAVIVFQEGEAEYHIVEWPPPYLGNPREKATNCGINQGELNTVIGTYGLELNSDVLVHQKLRKLTACTECFAYVW